MIVTSMKDRTGRRVFWGFVAFFASFMIVDALMIALALNTNTGVVTEQPYEKGLAYNRTLDAAQAQKELGWQGAMDYDAGVLAFRLDDAQGMPLKGADVKAEIERPVAAGMDRTISLTETAPGLYKADIAFPAPGLWNIRIFAQWQTHNYQQTSSLTIAP